jgi:endoglucanase
VPPAGSSACRVLFTPTDQWRTGFTADIVVTNSGPPVDGWTLRFPVASGVRLVHGWNGEWSQQANVVSVRSARWNRALPTGRSVTVGLAAQHGGQAPPPSGFTLDGAPCG